jgi:hypothetical protein
MKKLQYFFGNCLRFLFATPQFKVISTAAINADRAYRRSLIPDDLRIPQTGEIFQLERPVNAVVMITFAAPFTDGFDAVLPIGTKILIKEISEPKPIIIFCDPVEYRSLETLLVPDNLRCDFRYTGYYLAIETMEFRTGISPVADNLH